MASRSSRPVPHGYHGCMPEPSLTAWLYGRLAEHDRCGTADSRGAGNTISGNIQVGVYITSRDFHGVVYPVEWQRGFGNIIRSDGIYGVLLYDALTIRWSRRSPARTDSAPEPVRCPDRQFPQLPDSPRAGGSLEPPGTQSDPDPKASRVACIPARPRVRPSSNPRPNAEESVGGNRCRIRTVTAIGVISGRTDQNRRGGRRNRDRSPRSGRRRC